MLDDNATTKDKLATIVRGFDEFDSEMRKGTRLRREKDEFKITELKNEMTRLDSELTIEIKRRTEMNKSSQIWFEDQLTVLNSTVLSKLDDRKIMTEKRLEQLSDRISNLEKEFESQKVKLLAYVDERGEELTSLLNKFKSEFELDRDLRLEREHVIVKQLTDHEHEANERFEKQILSREARYSVIRAILEDNSSLRDKTESRFQAFFEREINSLRNEFKMETEAREREDDEIIEALNGYTLKLQNSLKVVNSSEL